MHRRFSSNVARRASAPLVRALAFLAAILALWYVPARAAETPIPPAPTTFVTDNAGVLSASTREQLESRLAAYNRTTGHQVIVWIGNTTGDAALEDWTIRAFTAWKVGRKGLNDGVALFIFMQDHKVRIEVGYGLEPVLTDAISSRIARNEIAARMKAGMVDEAVTAGVSALLATIGGEQGQYANEGRQSASNENVAAGLITLGIFVFIVLSTFGLIINAYRRMHTWYPIGSSGRPHTPFVMGSFFGGLSSGFSGGGGGGFGGFSGGGGLGGGGGASASW